MTNTNLKERKGVSYSDSNNAMHTPNPEFTPRSNSVLLDLAPLILIR